MLAACVAFWPAAALGEWKAVEQVKTYAIEGKSGEELYASIGERGPTVGGLVRAIAHTSFKLTWTRKYEPRGDACVLSSARPKLIITYVLPKPARRLPEAVRRNWDVFLSGVAAHERVHGDFIKDLVKDIERESVGLTVAADPECSKIRTELTARLGRLSLAQRQRSRDFDQEELSQGGNVNRLVLELLNGP